MGQGYHLPLDARPSLSSSSSAQTPAATRQGGESKKSWALPGGSELCPGDDDERCNLASDGSGAQGLADECVRARQPKPKSRGNERSGGCVFCNPNRLRAALRMRRGAVMTHVLFRFRHGFLDSVRHARCRPLIGIPSYAVIVPSLRIFNVTGNMPHTMS